MKKLTLILLALTLAVILLTAVGCKKADYDLDGKYIATFELNGGTLDYKTSSTRTNINFAYFPDTYIIAPEEIPGYRLYRTDYDFTGWYTSAECLPEQKWDFKSTLFSQETLTLYAGWVKSINHSYTVCYTDDNGEVVTLGVYDRNLGTDEGSTFSDWQKFATGRKGYTPIGFFSDPELTTPWDNNFKHPGGETDTNVTVYVSYIEGEWTLVSNYAQFVSAIENDQNVYLTENIDAGGENFANKSYTGHLEGNGYTISNLTVQKSGTLMMNCTLFSTLGKGTKITNVNFENVTFNLGTITQTDVENNRLRIAALARSASDTEITNVTISGVVITDFTGTLPTLNSAVYDSASVVVLDNFQSNITISPAN